MRKIAYLIPAIVLLFGCSGHFSKKELKEYGEIGYADIISFIVIGFQCQWNEMSPEEMELSPVYRYCSPYAGFAQTDIDGDGLNELLIGEQFEDGSCFLYDIYCIDRKNASPVHLASGGERDCFVIGERGAIIETGSNSAEDSFTKVYRIRKGRLVELSEKEWSEDSEPMDIQLQKFNDYL